MPTITIDTTIFQQIFNATDPIVAGWLIFKAGGWIPALIVLIKGLSWVWLNERQGIFISQQKKVFLAIDIPKQNEQLPKAVENIFSHLLGAYSTSTKKERWIDGKVGAIFSFEIVSIEGYIQFVVMSWEKYRDVLEALIYAQYPEAEITEIEDYTQFAPQKWPDDEYLMFATEFVPKKGNFYPIKTYPEFEEKLAGEFKDPMAGLLESLAKLQPGEQIWLQLLVQVGPQDWIKGAEKLVKKLIGAKMPQAGPSLLQRAMDMPIEALALASASLSPAAVPAKKDQEARSQMLHLSPGERIVVEAVERKIAKIGHNTKIRFLYIAPKKSARTGTAIAFVRGALLQFTTHDLNSLGFNGLLTTKRDYFWQTNSLWYYLSATFYRTVNERMRINFRGYKNRSLWTGGKTFVFNTEELATFWHFPVLQVKAPLVKKTEAKRGEPPSGLPVMGGLGFRFGPPSAGGAAAAPVGEPSSATPAGGPPSNLPIA
ncbi:hypothetical protein EPN90_02655 [Patescibacteria group bacterium]|nr:MAG: hypothetical protein EPN90_02655 [Patescibacteria group bacterium]